MPASATPRAPRLRPDLRRLVAVAEEKVFPSHYSFLLGEIALFSFLILVATGTYLGFFYHADTAPELYDGRYAALHGAAFAAAFTSTLRLSFDVPFGLVLRRMHHFAAHLFVAAIVLHVARVYFTGAFRRPREATWFVGVGLLSFALLSGFTGYCLPYDVRGGTALRMAVTELESLPWIGGWATTLLLGARFPSQTLLERIFFMHVLVSPALIALLLGLHLGLIVLRTHTQFLDAPPADRFVVGEPTWPEQATRSLTLLLLVAGVLAVLAAFFPVEAIWIYGPYDPAHLREPLEPDWFLFFVEGAYRMTPGFAWRAIGTVWVSVFFGGVLVPGILFGVLFAVPWIDRRVYGWGAKDHHALERARDRPFRAALGAVGIALLFMLSAGILNERIAALFHWDVHRVTHVLAVVTAALPPLAGVAVFASLRALARRRRRRAGASNGDV